MAAKSMTHFEEEEIRHVLGLPVQTSIVEWRHPSMIHEHIEIFDFYSTTSYNFGVHHALDDSNNNTQLHLRISCQS